MSFFTNSNTVFKWGNNLKNNAVNDDYYWKEQVCQNTDETVIVENSSEKFVWNLTLFVNKPQ